MRADHSSSSRTTGVIEYSDHSSDAPIEEAQVRRLFYLVDSLNVGGTERQAVELARGLDPARYRVTLGCLRARGPLRERLLDTRVEVREFYPQGGIDSVRGAYQLARLAMFLRRGRFDIFHSHDLWSNLMGVPAAWLARVPVIICSRRDLGHLDWYATRKRSWLRRIQRISNLVLTNANAIRDLVIKEGILPAKVRVIPNGIRIADFTAAPPRREQFFPNASVGQLIVLVGNMHSDVKGHTSLIRAAREILREFPQACFVFAGDGARRGEFERQASQVGGPHNFCFLGRRADVPQILASCDIAVLPSKAEGLSNALLEYMAAGLPVVATSVGGNGEVITGGETGLLVPPEDDRALAAAVLRLLRDPELAQRLAKRGQEHVERHFSGEQLIRRVDELYSELLAGKELKNA